jgi:serine/threonine protein phosphatase 1
VLEVLSQGIAEGRNWTCLMGNHDYMLLEFITEGTVDFPQIKSGKAWVHPDLGGISTIQGYGIAVPKTPNWPRIARDLRAAMPKKHLKFLQELGPYAERDGLLFVHAGIRPGTALADQILDDLIWIRQLFLNATVPHPWLVVHGHTAVKAPEHHGNRVNLDSGAGCGRPLSTAVFEGGEVCVLTDKGRQKLTP